jgi:hypothetical protein
MTLGIMIHTDVMYPVFPCTVDVTVYCTQRSLGLTIRAPPVKRLLELP